MGKLACLFSNPPKVKKHQSLSLMIQKAPKTEHKEADAKELYDKLESLLHVKHNEAKYESPLVGSFVSSCSFQSNKGIITLIIIERDYDYQVKMSYTDRINYIPVYRKQHQKELDDM